MYFYYNGMHVKIERMDHKWDKHGLTVIGDGHFEDGTRIHVVKELDYDFEKIDNALVVSGYVGSDGQVHKQPYKSNTSVIAIYKDGWARDFSVEQTFEEATAMGFLTSKRNVQNYWKMLDKDYEEWENKNG